ncbi:restriction endonuclease [Deinococcus marmoris]|uniref:restriction endonuclease n=1 Tax=Deinococcus marmoris TaxID=249408 RepID=UPI001115383B|nr:restriction endonuclease [Deinococcus marmoris]
MSSTPKKANMLEDWGVTYEELGEALEENPSLRGMVFGYVAEIKLRHVIEGNSLITASQKDDDHDRKKKGDRRFIYKDEEFTIESKSLQTKTVKLIKNSDGEVISHTGKAQVDASDRRKIEMPDGEMLETTLLRVGEFDILSVNCFAFEKKWRFLYSRNADLPRSSSYKTEYNEHLISSTVSVQYPLEADSNFTEDLFELLDELVNERKSRRAKGEIPQESMIIEAGGDVITAVEE